MPKMIHIKILVRIKIAAICSDICFLRAIEIMNTKKLIINPIKNNIVMVNISYFLPIIRTHEIFKD